MYLKSLEMQGFKSFPDRTKLMFDSGAEVSVEMGDIAKGVTVIVGPNGSGKSNIADAMRWVLGEISSKSLRGSKMEDVIFGGADSRRPMGYAEVSVTFDNREDFAKLDCPYDEVTVTRRYYRAGESEYFINRKAVRLRDIYELFMNTGIGRDGYSIIGQGKIAEMVSRKSEERRSVFEDASGIAKERHHREETERKLAEVENNMVHVSGIFNVVAAQVGPLEKEAEKAKRAIELLEEKKRADVSLWLYDTERLHGEIETAEEALRHAAFDLEAAEDSIRSLEVQNEKLFEASKSGKEESEHLLEEIRKETEECHRAESDRLVEENRIAHIKDLIASAQGTIAGTEKSIRAEQEAEEKHAARIGELENLSAELAGQRETLSAEQTRLEEEENRLAGVVAQALSDIREVEAQLTDVRVRASMIENSRETDTGKNTSALQELQEYRRQAEELAGQCAARERTVADYDAQLAALDEKLTSAEQKLEAMSEQLRDTTEQSNRAHLRQDSIAQRIATIKAMEEHLEGYVNAVRYVMNKYASGEITDREGNPCGKIYGPLSRVVSVEDRFITAIEIALGANLQNIVVEDERTAKAAMFALRRGEAGRATFFPLTSMRPSSPTKEMTDASGYEGYIGVADELVSSDPAFRNVLSSLLGRTVVFDNIDHANVMAKACGYRVRAVTLDGQQINVGGSFTGGSVRTSNGFLSRAGELKRLETELAEQKQAADALAKQTEELAARVDDAEDEKNSAEDEKSLIQVLRSTEAAHLEQLRAKKEANNTLLERLSEDARQLEEEQTRREEELVRLKAEEKSLSVRVDELTAFRTEKSDLHGETVLHKEELQRKLTDLHIRISETQKDIETAVMLKETSDRRIADLNAELDKYNELLAMRREQIAEKEEAVARLLGEQREANDRLEKLNAKRNEVEAGNTAFEKRLNDLNNRLRERMNHKELVFKEHTRCDANLTRLRETQDKLKSQFWDEYAMSRTDAVALGYPPLTKEQRPEMLALQTSCKNKLRAIGNVDLDAVNKYAEVRAQYDSLNSQITDLEASRKDLNRIIAELDEKMKTSFVDSFNKINENFGKVFAELFGGGSAELSLSDPENVLESGIEIRAAPPGKIIKSLMQLSGGEQAFVGVALFFAILQVNPTPFCILDEIEAALDEVNVERLAKYIKRYSHGTQFIMITHRRGTMAAADRLYGVTMPEHGISKVLMLNINDISKRKGEDWDGIFG